MTVGATVVKPEVNVSENTRLLLDKLANAGVEFAPSLPDTWVMDTIKAFDEDPRFKMIMVGREESAIGICTGAFFAGKGSIAVMGASGFMASIYAITKICFTYQIGFPILVTFRGGIPDRPAHQQANGTYLMRIIQAMDLPLLMLGDRASYDEVPDVVYHARVQKRPTLIGMRTRILARPLMSRDVDGAKDRFIVGLLVIQNDGVPERELRMFASSRIDYVVSRFASPRRRGSAYDQDVVGSFATSPGLRTSAELLAAMPLDAVALAYASGCLLHGLSWDRVVCAQVSEYLPGVPCFGAGTALATAWTSLGMRSPLLVLPAWFGDELVTAARTFGSDVGLACDDVLRADMGPQWPTLMPHEIYDRGGGWQQDPQRSQSSILANIRDTADGVVVIGSGLRAAEVVQPLEERLGRPVISPQQALLWYFHRRMAIEDGDDGFGRLFECSLQPLANG